MPTEDIQPTPSKSSKGLPEIGTSETCGTKPQNDEKIQELEEKAWFQDAVNEKLNIPTGYSKVAVLIVKWSDDIDPFQKGHNKEIKKLRALFEEKFHYECTEAQLGTVRQPQLTLNRVIIDHIEEHDGPNNLLIVYYTGHGRGEDKRGLKLSANSKVGEDQGGYRATAYWDQAETPLISGTIEADVLTILDCCFASNAHHKEITDVDRIYELIAAAPKDQKTRGPGETSFTAALISSLEELLRIHKDRNFTTSKLVEMICMKREDIPALKWDRLQNSNGQVQLAPLNPKNKQKERSFQSRKPEKAWIKLRFSLDQPQMTRKQIEAFARHLPHACHQARLPVRRIDWLGMASINSLAGIATALAATRRMKRGSQPSLQLERSFGPKRQRTGDYRKTRLDYTNYVTPSQTGSDPEVFESSSSPSTDMPLERAE